MVTIDIIKNALTKVIDPELGYNIVELGLVYDIKTNPISPGTNPQGLITITMTLTTPGCPMGPFFINQIKEIVAVAAGIEPDQVAVVITFDPPWSMEAASDDIRLKFGL